MAGQYFLTFLWFIHGEEENRRMQTKKLIKLDQSEPNPKLEEVGHWQQPCSNIALMQLFLFAAVWLVYHQ
jgi:hypothetical protein